MTKRCLYAIIILVFSSITILHSDITTGLVAHYPFNSNADNETGTGPNGTIQGAVPTDDRFGNANSAYSYDGNDYIYLGDSLDSGSNDLTLCVWIRSGNYNQYSKIINKGQTVSGTPANSGYSIRLLNASAGVVPSEIAFQYHSDANVGISTNAYTGSLIGGHYNFICGVLSRNEGNTVELKLYINGVIMDTNTDVAGPSDTNIPLAFGVLHRGDFGDNDEFFQGDIDDIRIYHRVLSQNDVLELYHLGSWMVQPQNIEIAESGSLIQLSWNNVVGATSYKVYSSTDPYSIFTVDTTGTFVSSSWSAPISTEKRFFYVTAER